TRPEGEAWAALGDPQQEHFWAGDISATPDGGLWLASNEGLFHFRGGKLDRIALKSLGFTNDISSISTLHCDAQGTVWMGTWNDGLARYDGSRLTRYTTANGLAENSIIAVASDPDGTVWIRTDHGVSRLSGTNFVNFTHAAEEGLPALVPFSRIYRDRRGIH